LGSQREGSLLALCALLVALGALISAAVGGLAGAAIGGGLRWIADQLRDFEERGKAVVNRYRREGRTAVHLIPAALTEPQGLGKRWVAWRLTVDT
jgi:hypothetical protein